MTLGGQAQRSVLTVASARERELGAQLLLSEVLEYIIDGLGVTPSFHGTPITEANTLNYDASEKPADKLEMVDGLADVAYTMYWNACAFGIPLEEAFELVCDNNLGKFVRLDGAEWEEGALPSEDWDCKKDIVWPPEVTCVDVVQVKDEWYAVGKDKNGKVRKPSSYSPVDLSHLAR